jgi:hypothetical protein
MQIAALMTQNKEFLREMMALVMTKMAKELSHACTSLLLPQANRPTAGSGLNDRRSQ